MRCERVEIRDEERGEARPAQPADQTRGGVAAAWRGIAAWRRQHGGGRAAGGGGARRCRLARAGCPAVAVRGRGQPAAGNSGVSHGPGAQHGRLRWHSEGKGKAREGEGGRGRRPRLDHGLVRLGAAPLGVEVAQRPGLRAAAGGEARQAFRGGGARFC